MALGDAKRLHQPQFRDAYVALLNAVVPKIPLFDSPTQRTTICLWVAAGSTFNVLDGARGGQAPGLRPTNYDATVPTLSELVEHIAEAHNEATKAAAAAASGGKGGSGSGSGSAGGKQQAGGGSGAGAGGEGAVALGPPEALLKARLADCLQRLYESFKQPWLDGKRHTVIIELFQKLLQLPTSWWPQGRVQRTPLERWASNMHASRR